MTTTTNFPVEIKHIRSHYDRLSLLYRFFWGEHLHHGYWENNESAARAQIKLMERLADRAGIPMGCCALDIGCGLGGSAFWLASQFNCQVTGITISPVQARMATSKAKARGLSRRVHFHVQDANEWAPEPASVDLIWIIESSEHFSDKDRFFKRCSRALRPGGILAVCAWLRRDGPLNAEEQKLVSTIAEAMMSASLGSLSDYQRWMQDAGLTVTVADDVTRHIEETWSHCARIGENPLLRFLLHFTGGPTQRFVRSFPLMKQAYAQDVMAFGMFVATKRPDR